MTAIEDFLIPGLRDHCQVVTTPFFAEIATRLELTARHAATLVVAGPHGTGKKVALMHAVLDQPLPHAYVRLPAQPSDKDVVRALYREVLQDRDSYDLRDMQDDLVDTLNSQRQIVVIADAQELTSRAASQLQYLHSQPNTSWALVLVGSGDVGRAASTSARLRGDILASVEVQPLRDKQLLSAVTSMHTLFSLADTKLLKLIDKEFCGGLLKRWAMFLQHALDLAGRAVSDAPPELDKTLARATAALMPPMPRRS